MNHTHRIGHEIFKVNIVVIGNVQSAYELMHLKVLEKCQSKILYARACLSVYAYEK